MMIDDTDRAIIRATQEGLPLTPQPYLTVAQQLGIAEDEVLTRVNRMLEDGIIRRIGVVPNHYALGYKANGMTVWDVPDERVDALGELIGGLDFVSHCYQRPRFLPEWPYNFFAMVHGRDRAEVEDKTQRIAILMGDDDRGHEILYSSRILKKTGLRLRGDG